MSEQGRRGTIIRGADGALYFVPDEVLAPFKLSDEQAAGVAGMIDQASDARRATLAPGISHGEDAGMGHAHSHGDDDGGDEGALGIAHGTEDEADSEESLGISHKTEDEADSEESLGISHSTEDDDETDGIAHGEDAGLGIAHGTEDDDEDED